MGHKERAQRQADAADERWERERGEDLAVLREINKLEGEERLKWHRVMFGFTPSKPLKFARKEPKEPAIREYWARDIFPDEEHGD